MNEITVFGKTVRIVEESSDIEKVELKNSVISIAKGKKSGKTLLEEFLTDLLHSQLHKIFREIISAEKVDVFGNLDFEVVKKIDSKKQRIAKLKRNKIFVKLSAVALPKTALKYLIAHEIAHIMTKNHGQKFEKFLKTIHPKYENAQKLILKFEETLLNYPIKEP